MRKKIWIIVIISIAVLGAVLLTFAVKNGYLFNDGPSINVICESSLREVVNVSKLSTAEYTYNSVAKIYDKDKKVLKCHAKYNGTVTAGIDFSKIDYDIDDDITPKKITIILPAIEIHDVIVDSGTIDYIFTNSKYETDEFSQEAYTLCIEDLGVKVKRQDDFLKIAKENAVKTIDGLVSPWEIGRAHV